MSEILVDDSLSYEESRYTSTLIFVDSLSDQEIIDRINRIGRSESDTVVRIAKTTPLLAALSIKEMLSSVSEEAA